MPTAALAGLLLCAPSLARADGSGELDLAALLKTDLTVVSATKMKQTVAESPSVISVVTSDDIQRRNYRSVAEALWGIPGIYVGTDYVLPDVGVRGVTGEMRGGSRLIKVLIDGRPVTYRNDTTNFLGPEMIPMAAVERIEVIRGPASALYGANAFLGVVNVVTKTGAQLGAATVGVSGNLFMSPNQTNPGYSLSMAYGKRVGALDVAVAVSRDVTNRSGLSLPCGSLYPDDATPCETQKSRAQDPSVFDRASVNDIAAPTALHARAEVDLGKLAGRDPGEYGAFRLHLNHQVIDTTSQFADWGTFAIGFEPGAAAGAVGAPIEGSVGRVGLSNTLLGAEYQKSFFEDLVSVQVAARYATGGTTRGDRIRDSDGFVTATGVDKERFRQRFGGFDLVGDVRWTLLEELGHVDLGGPMTLIKNITLIATADLSQDDLTYAENAQASPVPWTTSTLTNVGVLGQLTGSFLNGRLGLITGLRYDNHSGAKLSDAQLARVQDKTVLCENAVCYDALSYRFGATVGILKDVGSAFDGAALDSLYAKLLVGTAFKAPEPSFLYNDDTFGSRPVRANPGLQPQRVRSIEAVLGFEALGRHLYGSAVFFSSNLENQVVFARTQAGVNAVNAASVNSVGVEGALGVKAPFVDLRLSLATQNSERVLPETITPPIANTFAYPGLTFTAMGTFEAPWFPAFLTVAGRYVGDRVGHPINGRGDTEASRYTLPGWFELDLDLVSGQFELGSPDLKGRLGLSVRNLTNTQYVLSGFQPYYGTDLPGIPRTMMLRFEQTF